ncbi:MAG: DNA polymerase III subunit delta' C-terminal domain-containing protein, partial [Buchnera aphidicola]|nr:DNA polymerase III subunit delta' C-terminal domain-containing protein [Buchnera aphidicola]
NKNKVNLLPQLKNKSVINKIDWICLLLFDAIKIHFQEKKYLSNLDQEELIYFISKNYSNKTLDKSILTWIK